MADQPQPTIHIGENSAEHVAFQLLQEVVTAEAKSNPSFEPDKKYILDTYAECLLAVKLPAKRAGK
jgi:hypothetical protein